MINNWYYLLLKHSIFLLWIDLQYAYVYKYIQLVMPKSIYYVGI